MFTTSARVLLGAGLMVLLLPSFADAQIVRRFGGGGVQINAPFVRVNVGPGGATSVRAPFTAVDGPGRVFIGRRRRLMAQPQAETPTHARAARPQAAAAQPEEKQPEVADVDALPYPTIEQLAGMDEPALIETLRQMMARLHFRLSRLNTGEGWQKYLVLSREVLGSPGAPPEAADFAAIRDILPRYQSVQDDPQFTKISSLPSFAATFAALAEADRRSDRYDSTGRTPVDPVETQQPAPPAQPATEAEDLLLPTPQPTAVAPEPARGERSILKRK